MPVGRVGVWGAVAIGVGGMVGGVRHLRSPGAVGADHEGAAPLAFLLAGLLALLTARSYALLASSYPSRGGTVTFVRLGRRCGGNRVTIRDQLRRHGQARRHGPPRLPARGRSEPAELNHGNDLSSLRMPQLKR